MPESPDITTSLPLLSIPTISLRPRINEIPLVPICAILFGSGTTSLAVGESVLKSK